MAVEEISGQRVLDHGEDGAVIASINQALDLIGATSAAEASIAAVPADRLAPDFFKLSTGLAGEIIQKFQNYHVRLIVYGDISGYVAASTALRDFVKETNRHGNHLFVRDREAMRAALEGGAGG